MQLAVIQCLTKAVLYSDQLRTRYLAFFACLINCLDYQAEFVAIYVTTAVRL
jgi:hypothetical protein